MNKSHLAIRKLFFKEIISDYCIKYLRINNQRLFVSATIRLLAGGVSLLNFYLLLPKTQSRHTNVEL